MVDLAHDPVGVDVMYAILRRFLPVRAATVLLTVWYVVLLTLVILLADHAPSGDFRYGQL
jgi:hypothetical protein